MSNAYLLSPSIFGDEIVFSTDDDIWKYNLQTKFAYRLTRQVGECFEPSFSPDGKNIIYRCNENSMIDIYKIPSNGGASTRLTFCGYMKKGNFLNNDKIIVSTGAFQHIISHANLYALDINTLKMKNLNLGTGNFLFKEKEFSLLGKNIGNPARWKRYRGGTAGTFWYADNKGKNKDNFKQIFKNLKSNLSNPIIYKEKLYFISDHEGYGNIYKSNPKGGKLTRITNEAKFYVRSFDIQEDRIVYNCAGEIKIQDLSSKESNQLNIEINAPFEQASPRIIETEEYLDHFDISEDGRQLAISSRGKLFILPPWGGSPIRLGKMSRRYKNITMIPTVEEESSNSKNKIVKKSKQMKNRKTTYLLASVYVDADGSDKISLFDEQHNEIEISSTDLGKIYEIVASPDGKHISFTNTKTAIYILELKSMTIKKIDQSGFGVVLDLNWSCDSSILNYSKQVESGKSELWNYHLQTSKKYNFIPSVHSDLSGSYSDNGDYFYFCSTREFETKFIETYFDYTITESQNIYAITLKDNVIPPTQLFLNNTPDEDEEEEEDDSKDEIKKKQDKSEKSKEEVIIESGIENRISKLNLPMGNYQKVWSIGDKVFYLNYSLPNLNRRELFEDGIFSLHCYDLKTNKSKLWQKDIFEAKMSNDGDFFVMNTKEGLRVISTESKPTEGEEDNKKDGWIDLTRITNKIDIRSEWKQMFNEAWLLQRENFWTPDMSKVKWTGIYKNYLPLLNKVNTRFEFSDLLWEMQGELGTSHCYEFGGDFYRDNKKFTQGFLGADYTFDKNKLTIKKFIKGDSWIENTHSPLLKENVSMNIGDEIHQIDGDSILSMENFYSTLQGKAGKNVTLKIKRKSSKTFENVTVKLLRHELHARYRNWVNDNRNLINKKTNGKIGYIHLPDMYINGMTEFYRSLIVETKKEGLIIDVRYNGGGHVSQIILKFLAQKVLGFDITRNFGTTTYPMDTVNGPIICLTNEYAGSDGDIFSHCFKLMKLGKLIGKRTWGGVVGIWPRFGLQDGTLTSQPEFSHWFKDVNFQVENYGTEPDIEVDILPQDYKKGIDTQLERGIKEILIDLKKNPPLKPDLKKNRSDLSIPKLPRT